MVSIIKKKTELTGFDLIDSAGLYDYLTDSFAHSLTKELSLGLNKGGIPLVANFSPNLPDAG